MESIPWTVGVELENHKNLCSGDFVHFDHFSLVQIDCPDNTVETLQHIAAYQTTEIVKQTLKELNSESPDSISNKTRVMLKLN